MGWKLGNLTDSARGQLNKAAKELRGIEATPEDVGVRAASYRAEWPNATLTPTALVKHWPELEAGPNSDACECESWTHFEFCPKFKASGS